MPGIGITGGRFGGASAPSTPPSLDVALSSSTVDYGASLTITATPTGITPVNYLGFAKCSSNMMTYINEQESNIFNWAVNSNPGANKIYVNADDGTDGVFNVAGEDLTVTTNYLLNYTEFIACWSTIKRGETFSDPILRALRSSDSDEADFTPVTGTPEVFDGSAIASNAIPIINNGSTFTTFISTDNGTTPDIYDQTGNGHHASQSTLAKQPTIATGGVIESIGGYPCYSFDANKAIPVWVNATAPAAFQNLSDAITIIMLVSANAVGGTSSFWRPNYTICELRMLGASPDLNIPFSIGFASSRFQIGMTDNFTSSIDVFQSEAAIATGTLYQLAVVIDNDTVKIYIDGQLDSTHAVVNATGDRSVGTAASALSIGARSTDAGGDANRFDGEIIDLAITDEVLTDADILNIYNFYQS